MTGVFSWLTSSAGSNSPSTFTVRVTDNGSPALSAEQSFTVSVRPRPELQNLAFSDGNFVFTWAAIAGTRYRVQSKESLRDPVWVDLEPLVIAEGATAMFQAGAGAPQRFYRIRVLDR